MNLRISNSLELGKPLVEAGVHRYLANERKQHAWFPILLTDLVLSRQNQTTWPKHYLRSTQTFFSSYC